jgi:hypothetical protein
MRGIIDDIARRVARPADTPGFETRHVLKILADLTNREEEDLVARRDWEEDAYEIIPRAALSNI